MSLELQQLRQVIALAEHGSFVRAAATAIGRAVLTIDLGNHSLGY